MYITAPPGVVAYSVTCTRISFFIVQQDINQNQIVRSCV